MLAWRVYYADGSTYSNEDGDPYDAPGDGVQTVRFFMECGTPGLSPPADWYCWDGDGWMPHDLFGMYRYLMSPGPKKVLAGQAIETKDYQRIKDRAVNDPDFKVK